MIILNQTPGITTCYKNTIWISSLLVQETQQARSQCPEALASLGRHHLVMIAS